MKILWLCNIVLPELAEEFGLERTNVGGWITGMWQELKQNETLELGICVPIIDEFRRKDGKKDNYFYFSFPFKREENICDTQEACFDEILDKFSPDIVHIWGTEYYHTWVMIQACRKKGLQKRSIINIQGLLSFCYPLYGFCLSEKVMLDSTYGKTISDEKDDFINRSKFEVLALKNVEHVIGRTDWDRYCVSQISEAQYHNCGEILREIFYEDKRKWDVNNCERHSIFISQAGYPIKGLHLILENIYRLKKKYSDLKVFIAGTNLYIKETAYAHYICDEIKRFGLEETIIFVGPLLDMEMFAYYLKANVFLCSSTEENSSNSVCEAMSIGTPIVASYVGGIPSIVSSGESGFLYPLTEPYMMEYYISEIFENDTLSKKLSKNERRRVLQFNNRKKIAKWMSDFYNSIGRN